MLVPVVDECMIIPIAPYTGASVHLVFRLIFANFNKINKYMPFCRPTEALTSVARSILKKSLDRSKNSTRFGYNIAETFFSKILPK